MVKQKLPTHPQLGDKNFMHWFLGLLWVSDPVLGKQRRAPTRAVFVVGPWGWVFPARLRRDHINLTFSC